MASNSFFDEQKEQSLVKARIVEKYFWSWAKVITSTVKKLPPQQQRIAYIDLFAGKGRYDDGSKSTPIKVLERAIDDPDIRDRLVSIFNDADEEHVRSLQHAIDNISGINTLKYLPQIWNEEVGDNIVKIFKEKAMVPTLFFVDPWGYKGLSLQLINSVVKNWGCDCIFFFNYNRINMGLGNDAVKNHIDALFGAEKGTALRGKLATLNTEERELTIVEAICESLQEMGGRYTLPFTFKNERGTRTSHHLIFVSKHVKGYTIMKEIMAKESTGRAQGVPSFEYNPATVRQPLLFEFARPLDDLEAMLIGAFAGKTITMAEMFESHHVGRPYIEQNYKAALNSLESKGKIAADPPASKRRKYKGQTTFGESVRITFI